MPTINAQITANGPILPILVCVSPQRMAALEAAGKPVPPALPINALLDTGASNSAVDKTIVASLDLEPTGYVPILTPSTGLEPHYCNEFDLTFVFGEQSSRSLRTVVPVIETDFSLQGIDALLGRDVLERCVVIYNGTNESVSLSY